MGLIERVFGVVFGNGGNIVKETAEVFRPNAEASARREADLSTAALKQFAAEFARTQRPGLFDRAMDALNRVPRPAMALGTLGLFIAAMIDPVWFSARMQGIALVPEPLWWLLGAIVSFYFGARHQAKGQDFQRSLAESLVLAPQIVRNLGASDREGGVSAWSAPPDAGEPIEHEPHVEFADGRPASPAPGPTSLRDNPALAEWRSRNGV